MLCHNNQEGQHRVLSDGVNAAPKPVRSAPHIKRIDGMVPFVLAPIRRSREVASQAGSATVPRNRTDRIRSEVGNVLWKRPGRAGIKKASFLAGPAGIHGGPGYTRCLPAVVCGSGTCVPRA